MEGISSISGGERLAAGSGFYSILGQWPELHSAQSRNFPSSVDLVLTEVVSRHIV
jgi:hypothetical protein